MQPAITLECFRVQSRITIPFLLNVASEFLLVLKCPLKVTHMPSMWSVNFFQSILWSPNSLQSMIAILDDLKQRPGCCGMTDQANNSNRWSPINCYGKKAQSRMKLVQKREAACDLIRILAFWNSRTPAYAKVCILWLRHLIKEYVVRRCSLIASQKIQ